MSEPRCETSPLYHADSVCPDDSCGEYQPRTDANEKPPAVDPPAALPDDTQSA